MKTWIKNIFSGSHRDDSQGKQVGRVLIQTERFPINVLSYKIGDMLEVHYLDQGIPQIIKAQLVSPPTTHFFYLSLGEADMSIVYWHKTHGDGRVSAVKLIKQEDHTIYENEGLAFDYAHTEFLSQERAGDRPTRMITREYLSGMFG
jgi:hypothetical protein